MPPIAFLHRCPFNRSFFNTTAKNNTQYSEIPLEGIIDCGNFNNGICVNPFASWNVPLPILTPSLIVASSVDFSFKHRWQRHSKVASEVLICLPTWNETNDHRAKHTEHQLLIGTPSNPNLPASAACKSYNFRWCLLISRNITQNLCRVCTRILLVLVKGPLSKGHQGKEITWAH